MSRALAAIGVFVAGAVGGFVLAGVTLGKLDQ